MGDSPKWVKSRRRREKRKERKKERLNDGNNNGQATRGARKHAWRTQAAWAKKEEDWTMVITMASFALQTPPRVAHTKPPGSKKEERELGITMASSFWLKGHPKLHLIYLVNDILDHCIMKNAAALQVWQYPCTGRMSRWQLMMTDQVAHTLGHTLKRTSSSQTRHSMAWGVQQCHFATLGPNGTDAKGITYFVSVKLISVWPTHSYHLLVLSPYPCP